MVAIDDIQMARTNIADIIHMTPIFTSDQLSRICGNQMFLKAEHMQKTGSFKIRGASNKVMQPGDLTFPVIMKYIDGLVLVTEDEIRSAFRFVLERMKQLIEPASATTIAAASHNKLPFKNKKIVAVISGGNVDLVKIPSYI